MFFLASALCFAFVSGLTIDTTLRDSEANAELPTPLLHANHIFNAIHSSMRQWGSSLNHNGMSFFLASVPSGTQFYHGRADEEPVTGTEWLAFEPEHAMNFARPGPKRPYHKAFGRLRIQDPQDGQSLAAHGPDPDHLNDDSNMNRRRRRNALKMTSNAMKNSPSYQKPTQPRGENDDRGGYLHTYRATHPLSLLYIDGMSAGKTTKGTLDSTDYVLQPFNSSITNPMMGEWQRARGLCNMSKVEWEGRIDGFIRMEMGFEVILCDFEKHLEVVSISKTTEREGQRMGFGSDLAFYRAIASRFDGIGGDRVKINYDNFVTSFAYAADLFEASNEYPRLTNVSNTTLAEIRGAITKMILSDAPPAHNERENVAGRTNWQSVADMVVSRYSDRIAYLSSSSVLLLEQAQAEVEFLFAPYIDYGNRNTSLEVERCARQYLHSSVLTSPQPIAVQAIHNITSVVCNTLFDVAQAPSLTSAKASIWKLMDYLRWTTWKKCGSCQLDEICFIPVWPVGRKQDHTKPTCRSSIPSSRSDSYWGGFGPPGKRRGDERTTDEKWMDFEDEGSREGRIDEGEPLEHSSFQEVRHSPLEDERDHYLD
ncbi:MAG: hypothetical protein M1822_003262 [Bathelium mastoideum]|nr:MAG: hypothetical protein M1822_003262 [Bathelium mastoideum]